MLRLTCKTWKRELDLCSHSLEPAVCDVPRIAALFPNLSRLNLSGCSLTVRDEALQDLHHLKKLVQLDLRGCAGVFPLPPPPPPFLPSPFRTCAKQDSWHCWTSGAAQG